MPRSLAFERYLRSLPMVERKRIEAAESEYLERTRTRNAAIERDFGDSMIGEQTTPAGPYDVDRSLVQLSGVNPGLLNRSGR